MSKTVLLVLVSLLVAAVFMSNASASAASLQETGGKPSAGSNPATSNKSKKKVAPTRRTPKAQPPKEAWDQPMTVVLVRSSAPGCEPLCPEWLAAEGRITPNTPAVFRKTLQKLGKRWLPVVIQSPGGDVQAAMEIGRMLRKAKLPVGVGRTQFVGCEPSDTSCKLPKDQDFHRGMVMVYGSFCNSAYPLILAGGTERLAGPPAYVGLHVMRRTWYKEQITYRETLRTSKGKQKLVRHVISRKRVGTYHKDGIDKEYRRKILAYLAEMGVSPKYLDEMAKADYDELNHVSQERLRDLGLLTSEGDILIFLTPDVCKPSMPFRNCRALAEQAATPPPRKMELPAADEMMVSRVRAKGKCEPLCPEWIAAQGTITAETPRRFEQAFAQTGAARLPVLIDSQGGDLDAAIEVGRMIRARGASTLIATTMLFGCSPRDPDCNRNRPPSQPYVGYAFTPGDCMRECWFMFAGGVERLGNWISQSPASHAARFVTRRTGATAEAVIAEFMSNMSLSNASLSVDRAKLQSDLAGYDDNRIIMFRLSNDPGGTNVFAEPASCRRSDPPANCIMRDKQS